MAADDLSADAQSAIRSASTLLAPHAADARVAALITKMAAIADPVDAGDALVKAMGQMDDLRKRDDVPAELCKRADDAKRAVEREYLGRHNPAAAAAYEERGRAA